jgi:hypothetical protein
VPSSSSLDSTGLHGAGRAGEEEIGREGVTTPGLGMGLEGGLEMVAAGRFRVEPVAEDWCSDSSCKRVIK